MTFVSTPCSNLAAPGRSRPGRLVPGGRRSGMWVADARTLPASAQPRLSGSATADRATLPASAQPRQTITG